MALDTQYLVHKLPRRSCICRSITIIQMYK